MLHKHEIIKGIQMIKHAWKMCAEKLWPLELLSREQRMKLPSAADHMCPRLDDVQASPLLFWGAASPDPVAPLESVDA